MDRNVDYFAGRLDKDTYDKTEVAKLLLSESSFSARDARKEFAGSVSQEDFDSLSTELADTKGKLEVFTAAEFDKSLSEGFGKMNGNVDKLADFKKLADITTDMDAEAITAKATEMKESGNYDYLFTKSSSGGVTKAVSQSDNKPVKPAGGTVIPAAGLGWF